LTKNKRVQRANDDVLFESIFCCKTMFNSHSCSLF